MVQPPSEELLSRRSESKRARKEGEPPAKRESDLFGGRVESQDIQAELDRLEAMIAELKVQYEQYFTGLLPLPPDKLHTNVRMLLRKMLKAPFRTAAHNFRLKTLDSRYQTFNSYFQRVLKQREEGTYSRDVFKAEMHARLAKEAAIAQTSVGAAQGHVRALFDTFRHALEEQTGKKHELDFKSFRKTLVAQAKEMKAKLGTDKLTFKVVVREGKVTLQAAPA